MPFARAFHVGVLALLSLALLACEDGASPAANSGSDAGFAVDAGSDAGPAADSGKSKCECGAGDAGAGAASAEVRGQAAVEDEPQIDDKAYAAVVQQLNRFGLELGRRYAEKGEVTKKNSAYSPLSASIALSMTYLGAHADTAKAFDKVLSGGIEPTVFHTGVNRVARDLASRARSEPASQTGPRKIELSLADAVYVDKALELKPDFLDQLARNYDSGIRLEDFRAHWEAARLHINAWTAEHTHDRIQDLLLPGMLDDLTRVVLVNALYFYGTWQSTFAPDATRDADFHTLEDGVVRVPTMHNAISVPCSRGDSFVAVDLPYIGAHLSMFVVLPNEGELEHVRASVSADWLDAALSGRAMETVSLALPRFKLTTDSFQLGPSLIDMGLGIAFSPREADFSSITSTEPLFIDKVVQKAFISVDENGTEAAAATAVIVAAGNDAAPVQPQAFNVDRPFLFFIHDDTGAVLFSGHIVDPSAAR